MFDYRFIQLSFMASLLVSIISSIIGTFIVLRKMTSVTGSISHSAFGGLGIGLLLGINPLYAAIPFTIAVAGIFAWFKKSLKIGEESLLSIIWAFGMSLGIILMNFKKGYTGEVLGYLFGSILAVTLSDIFLMASIALLTAILFFIFFREFVLLSFDEEFALLKGINTKLLDLLFYSLTALAVVSLIKAAGVLVVIAFISVPPLIARRFTDNIKLIILISFILNILFSTAGIILSFYLDFPTGPSMVMTSLIIFFAVSLIKR
ncbi:MAG: metal ABC transporter permease [bacterium]